MLSFCCFILSFFFFFFFKQKTAYEMRISDWSSDVCSSDLREVGSSCIIERRGIEMIDTGAAVTPFLNDGEWVTMRAVDAQGRAPFGGMRTQVRVTEKAL